MDIDNMTSSIFSNLTLLAPPVLVFHEMLKLLAS